jgi:hypothetical protein
VLAVARKFEKAKRACSEKESISNIFVKKESKCGKAMPVQQPQSRQLLTNANASRAKRPCNRCGKDSTYEQRQNCPAKADTCTKCKKKGHRAIICHKRKEVERHGTSCFCNSSGGRSHSVHGVPRIQTRPTAAAAEAPAAAARAR